MIAFCPFLSSTIITGQRSFSILADGLLNITPEKKIVLKLSTAKSASFFEFCNIWQIFKISVFSLIYLLTRLENKVAVSNQAKASLTKPWLATDEANRSPVV